MDKFVYIIILNWNRFKDTVECVESCRKLSYPNFRILIVDNGSSDGSEAILCERFPNIEVLQTGSNLGFAEGNNVGIRHALAEGADFVWLLNNDTTVETLALKSLVKAAMCDDRIGMVGSKILYYDDPSILWFAGTFVSQKKPFDTRHRGLMEKDRGQYDEECETDYITGCSLLVKKELIVEIGALDASFFLYFEDIDWCARARARGWRLMYSPQSRVLHKISRSSGGEFTSVTRYYTARNLLYFVKKNFPENFFAALEYTFFQHVIVPVKKLKLPAAVGGFKGIIDYLLARTGRKP